MFYGGSVSAILFSSLLSEVHLSVHLIVASMLVPRAHVDFEIGGVPGGGVGGGSRYVGVCPGENSPAVSNSRGDL